MTSRPSVRQHADQLRPAALVLAAITGLCVAALTGPAAATGASAPIGLVALGGLWSSLRQMFGDDEEPQDGSSSEASASVSSSNPTAEDAGEEAIEDRSGGLGMTDEMIQRRIAQKEKEDAIREHESEIWPLLDPEVNPEKREGGTIKITFEDLRSASPLLADSIRKQLDRVRPRQDTGGTNPDEYHVRTDGPRYDLRHRRSS